MQFCHYWFLYNYNSTALEMSYKKWIDKWFTSTWVIAINCLYWLFSTKIFVLRINFTRVPEMIMKLVYCMIIFYSMSWHMGIVSAFLCLGFQVSSHHSCHCRCNWKSQKSKVNIVVNNNKYQLTLSNKNVSHPRKRK